ncbi:GNAT family N-acetyltransferase [Lysinibacillus piscis]|uniref:Acetyltransferase n=1 Tax=Lysinibacillus piscis TaxID=2518931 RepID=A0ABQ5NJE1_9BACI|nr:GNAT family N-acetyltransferase [Lysinibacillus sp. KH24]GLC88485.1 acetyltransferase [Lysinibacillus sp. KH24]
MEIKLVEEKDYQQIHQLRDYCFPNKYTDARRKDFHHWVEHSTTLGAYDGNKVVGQVLVLPLNMTIHGENYEMGGIGFVASYPEYRQQGIVKKLMMESLRQMRQNGQTVSVLAPFSVSFYRYFGWELFFDKLHYSIPQTLFPILGKKIDVMKRMSFEWVDPDLFQAIKEFHNEQALRTNGGMLRDDVWWNRLESRAPDSHLAAYFKDDQIAGYIRYAIQGTTFVVHDFVVKDMEAEQAIWRYVTSHAASVTTIQGVTANHQHFGFYFQEPQFKREIVQDIMVRIVDVLAFMKRYQWESVEKPLYVRIEDRFCEWNEQLYQINGNGDVQIMEENTVAPASIITLPIHLFSAMMVGHLSIKEAVMFAGQQYDKEIIDRWQQALPANKPVFYEYF